MIPSRCRRRPSPRRAAPDVRRDSPRSCSSAASGPHVAGIALCRCPCPSSEFYPRRHGRDSRNSHGGFFSSSFSTRRERLFCDGNISRSATVPEPFQTRSHYINRGINSVKLFIETSQRCMTLSIVHEVDLGYGNTVTRWKSVFTFTGNKGAFKTSRYRYLRFGYQPIPPTYNY